MIEVVCVGFGGVDQLELREVPTPDPAPGQARVRLTSIGLNHADLMARRGEYKLYSGAPPFVMGLEGGGVVEAVGDGVRQFKPGDRVILAPEAPRHRTVGTSGGTYRSHYLAPEGMLMAAPVALEDDALGGVWLPYLTAWGCLVWKQGLRAGQTVGIPAASSGVGIAAAQIARQRGAVTIGMTTSAGKAERLRAVPGGAFDHIVVTRGEGGRPLPWHKEVRAITGAAGVDVFFDPVAAGEFLEMEIHCLGQHGTIWIYGLLGEPGKVDVTPLIRKHASVRGWVLGEIMDAGRETVAGGCREILDGIGSGELQPVVGGAYRLADVRRAHEEMERGAHIGKLVLVP
jgi:NADPH:quinone reductase-like Zn-dependent oxidoreductase